MNGSHSNAPSLAELFDTLARHRKGLLFAYFSLLTVFCLFLSFRGLSSFVDILAAGFGMTPEDSGNSEMSWEALSLFFVILGFQVCFLWIWGRLRDEPVATSFFRMLLPFLMVASLLCLTIFTILMSCLEIAELWGIVPDANSAFDAFTEKYSTASWILGAMAAILLATFVYRFIRRRSRCQALWRMAQLCLVAALVDFTLALPIELAVRGHKEGFLAFLTGSIFALLFSLLLLFWSLGLIIYLLAFRTAYAGASAS